MSGAAVIHPNDRGYSSIGIGLICQLCCLELVIQEFRTFQQDGSNRWSGRTVPHGQQARTCSLDRIMKARGSCLTRPEVAASTIPGPHHLSLSVRILRMEHLFQHAFNLLLVQVMDHDHGLVLCLLSTNQWDWRPISTQQYYGPRLQLRIGTGNTCRLRGRESGGWGQHRGHLRWISLGTEGTTFLDPVSGIHPVRNK